MFFISSSLKPLQIFNYCLIYFGFFVCFSIYLLCFPSVLSLLFFLLSCLNFLLFSFCCSNNAHVVPSHFNRTLQLSLFFFQHGRPIGSTYTREGGYIKSGPARASVSCDQYASLPKTVCSKAYLDCV